MKELINLANHLDSKGLTKEADYLDMIIKESAQDENEMEKLIQELTKINKEFKTLQHATSTMSGDKNVGSQASELSASFEQSAQQASELLRQLKGLKGKPESHQAVGTAKKKGGELAEAAIKGQAKATSLHDGMDPNAAEKAAVKQKMEESLANDLERINQFFNKQDPNAAEKAMVKSNP